MKKSAVSPESASALIDERIAPALSAWAGRSETRLARIRLLFALDGAPWNEERVLERYELLYEAGLAPEAARDRSRASGGAPAQPVPDHGRAALAPDCVPDLRKQPRRLLVGRREEDADRATGPPRARALQLAEGSAALDSSDR